jgi:hypothetical protein
MFEVECTPGKAQLRTGTFVERKIRTSVRVFRQISKCKEPEHDRLGNTIRGTDDTDDLSGYRMILACSLPLSEAFHNNSN